MRVTTVRASDLDGSHLETWRSLQAADPALGSPYFCPEFTQAVAAVRRDVFVGVIEEGARAVGFFPFQRRRFGRGRPVGGPLSDCHGVIAPAELEFSAVDLLRESGLASFEFDHLPCSQQWFSPHIEASALSPTMDLSAGYEAYKEQRRQAGSKQILKAEGLARKAEREVGPIRFDAHVADREALAAMMNWKSEQCRRTGSGDIFSVQWTRELMLRLLTAEGSGFSGMLSTLHIGGTLAAVHMGMRSSSVWHYWFPSYEQELARFSPGLLLLLRMAEAAPEMGIRMIDLGKGEMQYKDRLMSGGLPIAEGRVELPSVARAMRLSRRTLDKWASGGALGAPFRLPLKVIRKVEHMQKFA